MGGLGLGDRLSVADPERVVLVSAAHGMNEFFSVALPPVLPLLVADFGLTYARAGVLLTVFFVTYSVCQLPAGLLADRVGKVPMIAASVVGLAGGVLLASTAQGFGMLAVAQVLGGVAGSAYHPAGMALISDVETAETEGSAMGVHGFGGLAGVALAPVLIGGLADSYTWRIALVAAGVVGLVFSGAFIVLAGRGDVGGDDAAGSEAAESESADESAADGGPAVDDEPAADGAAPQETDVRSGESAETETPVTADAPRRERLMARARGLTAVPLTRWLATLLVLQFLVALEIRAAHSFTTTFAYERAGFTTGTANLVFLALLVGSAIASLWAGDLADRLDRTRLGIASAVLAAATFGLTPLVPTTLLALVGWFFVVGLAMYVQAPAMNAITATFAERAYSGGLFGVMATGSAAGGAVAPTLFGVLATYYDEGIAFAAIGVVCLFGAATFAALADAPFRADDAGTAN